MSKRPCQKRRYRDELAARVALATIRRKDDGKHLESRVHYCRECMSFHLTSRTPGQVRRSKKKAEYFRRQAK